MLRVSSFVDIIAGPETCVSVSPSDIDPAGVQTPLWGPKFQRHSELQSEEGMVMSFFTAERVNVNTLHCCDLINHIISLCVYRCVFKAFQNP